MTEIYVLNRNFEPLGIIDEYVSTIWRPAYCEIGDFEIYLATTKKAVELLRANNYVVRASDITVDAAGNTTYKNVMIIKNIQLVTDVENGDFMTVTGRELKFILHQRLVWSQTNLKGTAEAGIRRLVTENAISPSDTKRNIPGLILGESSGLTDTIEKQITAKPLDESIIEICNSYGYGWDIYVVNNSLIFKIYQGVDRSYNQSDRPYVVFSEDFDNLYNTEYQLNSESYANTALVGGEGEGKSRKYVTVGKDNSGLDRYEVFVDAKSVSSDSEESMTNSQYNGLLTEQGKEKLSELQYTEGFTGELLSDVAYKYGVDFFLGDMVTVINKYGIVANTNVLSTIETQDESGTKIIPQFNI